MLLKQAVNTHPPFVPILWAKQWSKNLVVFFWLRIDVAMHLNVFYRDSIEWIFRFFPMIQETWTRTIYHLATVQCCS